MKRIKNNCKITLNKQKTERTIKTLTKQESKVWH